LLHLQDGVTALMKACLAGHLDVARLLLDRGAKVDATYKVGCWCMPSSSVPCISSLHGDAECMHAACHGCLWHVLLAGWCSSRIVPPAG
jgi:ankyrin repeat protein